MTNEPKVFAAHLADGDGYHAVFVSPLRVLISKSRDGGWFAQGLEIDYAVQGTTPDDVRERFQRGFMKTLEANLKRFGDIAKLIRVAPQDCWQAFFASTQKDQFSCVLFHDLRGNADGRVPSVPFDRIEFRTVQAA